MDISVIEKIKSRKLAAVVMIAARFIQIDAPWQAFLYLGLGYIVAEAVQMSVAKLAEAAQSKIVNRKSELPNGQ